MSQNGTVSCIMPTTPERHSFIPEAVECFLAQTWAAKELVILNDGGEPLRYEHPLVRVVNEEGKSTIGAKRNRLCELAEGEIICHFDDDDWSSPERIAQQVEMLQAKPVAGYSTVMFWDGKKAYFYKGAIVYVCGATLAYRKSWWAENRFRDVQTCEDNAFIRPAVKRSQLYAAEGAGMVVARIHGRNTASHHSLGGCRDLTFEELPEGFRALQHHLQYQ